MAKKQKQKTPVTIIRTGIHGMAVKGCSLGKKNRLAGAEIISNLHEKGEGKTLKAAWDALESMVLAHAVAGVDITTPAYKEGLETAIDAVLNQYGD